MTDLCDVLSTFRARFDDLDLITPSLGTVYNPMQYAWAPLAR